MQISRSLSSVCASAAETWTALRAERARVLRLESAVLAQSLQLEREGCVRTQLERRRALLEREVLRKHHSCTSSQNLTPMIRNPLVCFLFLFNFIYRGLLKPVILSNYLFSFSRSKTFFAIDRRVDLFFTCGVSQNQNHKYTYFTVKYCFIVYKIIISLISIITLQG